MARCFTENRVNRFSIFTGRERYEAQMTLDRFCPNLKFNPVVGADDVKNAKPAPVGIKLVQQQFPGVEYYYVGDTVDDARSAAEAGVPFFGISPSGSVSAELLEKEGAIAVVDDINQLGALLCQ